MTNNILTMEIVSPYDRATFGEYYPQSDYGLRSWRGLDALNPTLWTRSSPFEVGVRYTGRKVNPRTANFTVSVIGTDEVTRESSRRRLAALLSPMVENDIYFNLIGGDRVYGRCMCTRTNFDAGKTLGHFTEYIFQMRFNDPLFYGVDRKSVSVAGVAREEGLDIPLELPMEMGEYSWGTTIDVDYSGTWAAVPIIRLLGPMNNVIVQNITTGGILRLNTGFQLPAGHTFEFNPQKVPVIGIDTGVKIDNGSYTVNEAQTNLQDWQLVPGMNELTINAVDTTSASAAQILWREVFVGV